MPGFVIVAFPGYLHVILYDNIFYRFRFILVSVSKKIININIFTH